MPENSVDAVVTDPPYGLKFMGKKWDYDVPKKEMWLEVLRVLKPGGHLLSFGGTRTYHRLACSIEDAGFEIRDQIQWLYGSGFPKSHNIGDGRGTALKPANEPIVLARKPLEKGLTVAENVIKWGCGALNIDGSRIGTDTIKISKGKGFGDAGIYGTGINTSTANTEHQGRWPANLLLDEVAAEMLDEQSGVSPSNFRKQKGGTRAFWNNGSKEIGEGGQPDAGGASRFFYVAKASKRERNAGLEGMPERESSKLDGGAYVRSGGVAHKGLDSTQIKSANHHPTVKPIKLMEYLCKLITPPGGVILDPFMGSGSTGVAAKNLNFKFIGIEMNEEYVEIAKKRINQPKVG